MKKFCKGMLLLGAMTCGLASCSDDSPWAGSDSEGGISLSFSTDARVMRQSKADDSMSPILPDESQFAVNLAKTDGTYAKDWSTIEAFNREKSFPIGDYTITATYGNLDVEGFTNPCYRGSTDVHVSPGAESQAHVIATLANAMVSIRYTQEFCDYFQAYSASVQTEGHDWVVFAQDEDRPAYVAPSEVKLNLTLTNQSGQQVTIQPASFDAQARHHYVVTIGLQDAYGNVTLDIQFDDEVVAETVAVSLGEELFTAPAPSVTAKDFNPDVEIKTFENAAVSSNPEFHVFAFGGLKSATLNIIADNGHVPAFGRSVELVNADPLVQSQLSAEGVVCSGFFKNVDKLGVVNVSKFLSRLPAGSYTIQLQVVDAMTRTSEPLSLSTKVESVEFEFSAPEAVAFKADEVSVEVETNCLDIKDEITFKVQDANNRMVDATVKSVQVVDATRSADYKIRYTLALEPQGSSAIDVTATLGKRTISTKVPVIEPSYSLTVDPYSHHIVIRVNSEDPSAIRTVMDNVRISNNGISIPTSNIAHDSANNYIVISGLTPATTYDNMVASVGSFNKKLAAFTTENGADVPNGSFSSVSETININPINVGGKYTGTRLGSPAYQLVSSIVRSTPNGWADLNPLTCYTGASAVNSWFVVPSTWIENGRAVIRSVGYSHNGAVPSTTKETSVYYCKNAPTDAQLSKSRGELFLGSYTFNGSENRQDGIIWSSRPASFSFDYSYAPYNNEEGEAYIKILDASGNPLAEETIILPASATMTTKTVSLAGYSFGSKAAKILLGFKSTKSGVTPAVKIPSGSELNENAVDYITFTNPGNHPIAANGYKSVATGSQLVIDNVKFGYDFSYQTISLAKKKTAKRR